MSAAAIRKERSPYQQPLEQVVAAFDTDVRNGLTQAEARSRLERYGRNELTAKMPVPARRKFLAQFQEPLVLLLLVATVISAALWLYERDSALPYEAMVIFAVVRVWSNSNALQTAEAALTGESLPVSKDTAPIEEEVGIDDRHNMIFNGTIVTYGHGYAVVTATGMQTQMGRITGAGTRC